MHFQPKNKKISKINLKIGAEELEEKEFLTYLGIIIDNKLNFNEHYKKVFNKVKSGLNGLIMIKNQLNYRAKLSIYHSLIHSHLSYCALIWLNNIKIKQRNMLKTIQKKAIRIIHGTKYNAHTNELFHKSKITKVENIFEKQSLILTYYYEQKKLPDSILKLYDNSLHNNSILTRYLNKCSLKPKNELKNGHLMYEILNNWNNTNKSIREEVNLRAFKRKIMELQNSFTKCVKVNCYSCNN